MIGLIVDGDSDRRTIPILASKILPGAGVRMKLKVVHRGHKLNVQKMERHVKDMIKEQPNLEKIIVCMDSEDEDLVHLETEINKTEQQLARRTLRPTYILVVRMLESWLLADEQAIKEVLGPRAKVKPISNPELIADPKGKLQEIIRRAGRTFLYVRDGPIFAEKVRDIQRIKQKCPRFVRFCEAVLDP